jgi:PD-(D/E)XK endonuclease
MARARRIGLTVLKPYGDSSRYDVGIEHAGRLVRVQIKSTTFSRGNTFTCNLVGPGRRAYAPGVVDFFAVYLVPMDRWYIIPFAAASKTSVSLQFTPQKQGHK